MKGGTLDSLRLTSLLPAMSVLLCNLYKQGLKPKPIRLKADSDPQRNHPFMPPHNKKEKKNLEDREEEDVK